MVSIFRYIQRLALVFWLGQMLFFAGIFAPTVFRVLPRESAAQLQNAIFPQYFGAGIVCAILILVTELFMRHFYSDAVINDRKYFTFMGITVFCLAIFVACRYVITPQLHEHLSAALALPPGTHEAFQNLHRWSVTLNGTVLVGLLMLLGLLA